MEDLLTTEKILNCFKGFIGGRGLCQTVYSDNATNFKGASNALKRLHSFFKDAKCQDTFAKYFCNLKIG